MIAEHHTPAPAEPRSRVRLPHIGDLLLLTEAASVQFHQPIRLRVIRLLPWATYVGWCWIRGYEIDETGVALAERDLFVQLSGLRFASEPQSR